MAAVQRARATRHRRQRPPALPDLSRKWGRRFRLLTAAPRLLFLSRQANWVFVGALAELATQAGGQRNRGFAEAVAHVVGGGQRALPALVGVVVEQVQLRLFFRPSGSVHAQQPHGRALLPVAVEQRADLFEQ